MDSEAITINGVECAIEVPLYWSLSDFLRDKIRLQGGHTICEHGVCGACTVLFDEQPVRSCLMPLWKARGHRVVTVEGLDVLDRELAAELRISFLHNNAFQCGFCTSGMLVVSYACLASSPAGVSRSAIRESISSNLCRCTGYSSIVNAVEAVALRREDRELDHA